MTDSHADIGEERAKQAAIAYLVRIDPALTNAWVQSVHREGPHYVVSLMPENKMGILLFFVLYKIWVNASTGHVDKFV